MQAINTSKYTIEFGKTTETISELYFDKTSKYFSDSIKISE